MPAADRDIRAALHVPLRKFETFNRARPRGALHPMTLTVFRRRTSHTAGGRDNRTALHVPLRTWYRSAPRAGLRPTLFLMSQGGY